MTCTNPELSKPTVTRTLHCHQSTSDHFLDKNAIVVGNLTYNIFPLPSIIPSAHLKNRLYRYQDLLDSLNSCKTNECAFCDLS